MNKKYWLPVAIGIAALGACDSGSNTPQKTISTMTGVDVKRALDAKQIVQGEQLYKEHCAGCHGAKAEGNPNWRTATTQGKYLPPPLNGTGREWHSSRTQLHNHIKYGSEFGKGDMPGFQNKLTDQQITAVMAWFQSLWPDQLYAEWVTKHTVGNVFVDESYQKQQ